MIDPSPGSGPNNTFTRRNVPRDAKWQWGYGKPRTLCSSGWGSGAVQDYAESELSLHGLDQQGALAGRNSERPSHLPLVKNRLDFLHSD